MCGRPGITVARPRSAAFGASGDGPLGGNSGECRESADQKVGVGGCLEFAWHRAGADGGHRHTGARDLGVHRLREGG
ncbi:hypothetical protein MHEC_40920 [Mycobacterium heckeshornense]|uniref:Uncharacterized protein n=1 Tax=Mycobacterium heckeshornense TaxID=110505 RepID=A0A7R7GXE4_9MYCO|nr:hypothetical protein MHEC_40920 [Mycobacterium heckeshornense]